MSILLVEDEQLILEQVAEILEDEGFNTCAASTSEQAVDLIRSPPKLLHLLVTDVDLPGELNGVDLAQLTHCYYPSLPVLYITGRPDKIRTLGPNEALLAKPFSLMELIRLVRQLLSTVHFPQ